MAPDGNHWTAGRSERVRSVEVRVSMLYHFVIPQPVCWIFSSSVMDQCGRVSVPGCLRESFPHHQLIGQQKLATEPTNQKS